jgi:O-antigen ligase
MALVGLASYALRRDLAESIQIPGLVLHGDHLGLEARGYGFVRVGSTATHYIEFSTVMAMVLPFAIHLVMFARTKAMRQNALISSLLIAAAIPVALSRTGILAAGVGLLSMSFAWGWRTRLNVGGIGIAVLAGIMVVQPGLLGTIRSLFLGMGNDPSIQGRTQDWDTMMAYFAERPWFGRGMGTFIPDLYIVVDNQWLQQLVGGGLIGVAALLALHVAGFVAAMVARSRSSSAEDRHLCACIASIQPIAIVANATFDSFAFSTFVATLALITGMSGTIWRLSHPNRQVRASRAAGVPAV